MRNCQRLLEFLPKWQNFSTTGHTGRSTHIPTHTPLTSQKVYIYLCVSFSRSSSYFGLSQFFCLNLSHSLGRNQCYKKPYEIRHNFDPWFEVYWTWQICIMKSIPQTLTFDGHAGRRIGNVYICDATWYMYSYINIIRIYIWSIYILCHIM